MKRLPILVIDDDPRTSEALASASYEVEAVRDVATALATVEGRRFGVVVADPSIAGVAGVELLREIRARDADVPFVLVGTSPSAETVIAALECGAVRYLAKPLDAEGFVATVARAELVARLAGPRRRAASSHDGVGEEDDVALEARFDAACTRLWMAYQPICEPSGAIVAYEALLRTDERSLASPPRFLAAAEKLGRLEELGRRIRAEVADAIDEACPEVEMFVNLHPFDLADDELVDPAAPLSRVASRVVLEITERASLDGVKDAKERIAALRALGFRVAIDDLGAGYAGLSWLTTVEPEVVKIDMGLVRGIDGDPKRQQVVGCLIELCARLSVRVVVEGVETEGERATLVALGADRLQGYLLGRPERHFGSLPTIPVSRSVRPATSDVVSAGEPQDTGKRLAG